MKKVIKFISILISTIIIIVFPIMSNSQDTKTYPYIKKEEILNLESFYKPHISPGKNQTELNFSWYSTEIKEFSRIKVKQKYNNEKKIYTGTCKKLKEGLLVNNVIIKELKENTNYQYSYECNREWSEYIDLNIGDFSNYSFAFMADPQIGALSKEYKHPIDKIVQDSKGWNKTIENCLKNDSSISFIICGGDETNTKQEDTDRLSLSELEYSGFLLSHYLSKIPLASVIGNHDKDNKDFCVFFHIPNMTNLGKTNAGGDYYFIYGDALYLILNTNNLDISEHQNFINETVQQNKDIKWKIVALHQDIYGGGSHKNDEDVKFLRSELPKILENNKIDLVLCGHDHIYSRSYPIKNNKSIDYKIKKEKGSNKVIEVANSNEGIVYITGSSCSGSKFYESKNHEDKYIRKIYDNKNPTYTIIQISEEFITLKTYESNKNRIIDNEVIIQK